MPFRPAFHLPLFVAGFGAVFLTVALLLLSSDSAKQDLARGEALTMATAATLRMHPVGEVVLVQGRLAADNRAVFREFLACQRDRYDGLETSGTNKGRERWTRIETLAPPLKLETGDGTMAIINQGYELRVPPHSWEDKADRSNLFGKDGERAFGFIAGDIVTVEGRVVVAPAVGGGRRANALEALVLFGGDHAAYLDYLRGEVMATRIVGGVFLGVGAVLLVSAGLLLWRAQRSGKEPRPSRR